MMKADPPVILLTGLSGSGKTSLALALSEALRKKSIVPVILDGDEMRKIMGSSAFDEPSRKLHNLKVGALAALLQSQGHTVIIALIAPYEETRSEMRKMCGRFYEVYLSASLETCMQRDPKQLYQKALKGEIPDFTGISAPYFPPRSPDLELDTGELSVAACTASLMELIFT